MSAENPRRCPWAEAAPVGLADAAEGWGITRLEVVFYRAHSRAKYHDDKNNPGHCYVCGGPLNLDDLDLDKEDES